MDKGSPVHTGKKSRRNFILRGCLLFLVAGVLWVGWWWRKYHRPNDCSDVLVAMLKERLGYLKHDPAGLERFAKEYQAYMDPYFRKRFVRCGLFLPVYGMFDSWVMKSGKRDGYVNLIQPVITRYLFSTGFFDRARGGSPDYNKTLDYQEGGIHASLICANPWADLSLK